MRSKKTKAKAKAEEKSASEAQAQYAKEAAGEEKNGKVMTEKGRAGEATAGKKGKGGDVAGKATEEKKCKGGSEIPADGRYVFTSADGVVLCELRVSVTDDTGDGRAQARANKLADAYRAGALLLARDRLFPEAEAEYLKSDDPRKRFTARRYIVTLEGVRLPAPDGILSMRFRLTVARGGKELTALTRGAVIDSRGRLCPHTHFTATPKSMKMQFSRRKNAKKIPRRVSTWYIDGNFAVLIPKAGSKTSSECAKVPIKNEHKAHGRDKKEKRANC